MLVELRPLNSITPYDRNPRKNDAAVDAVARSINWACSKSRCTSPRT
jgi:hypothetical protein